MKALLNEEGVLKIVSENPLEPYALKKWWEAYQGEHFTARLAIDATVIEKDNEGVDE